MLSLNTIFWKKLMRLFKMFLWELFEDVIEFSAWEKDLNTSLDEVSLKLFMTIVMFQGHL